MKHLILKNKFWAIQTFLLHASLLFSFSQEKNSGIIEKKIYDYSNPDFLSAPPLNSPGYPSRAIDLDVLHGFENPPPGYGEVPYWWWSGDSLNKERILWQIEELHKAGISGMQVNYIHKDSPGWPTYPVVPEIFSDEWWSIWKFTAAECSKRNMGLGMSGYTLDWPKSDNLFNKIIYGNSEIQGREIKVDTILKVREGNNISFKISDNLIGVWAYPVKDNKIQQGGVNLESFVNNLVLNWIPKEGDWEIWLYTAKRIPGTLNPIHPLSGKTVIEKYFQLFQDHALDQSAEGLNYFFQDELKFGVGDYIWCDDFAKEFKERKGYDVFEVLPALFTDIGSITPKALLDFMDVKVRLSEERYFIPIFNWHWSRGKIYGCDPMGRGMEPGNYGDNFQAIRWYTAPGHDTPGGYADLMKGKVSSSIANLYKRPRVWLEGYHSLGWGAAPERLMNATNENFLYGCNLLNLHGLYYSTYGSYWEWAPPCYHFRMPYWQHMKIFLKYFERLSYLLSQGVLQSDIAVLYPVTPFQAKMDGENSATIAFASGSKLFNNGYDFVFIDDQSIARSEIADKKLNVSDMSYKVLILPDMKAVRWVTISKAFEFYRSGGIVIAVGSLPSASDRIGKNDPLLNSTLKEIFGSVYHDDSAIRKINKNSSGGLGIVVKNSDELLEEINNILPKDIESEKTGNNVRALHRKAGFRDIYMVMGAAKNSTCTFRSKGIVERWDPWTGKIYSLPYAEETIDGTKIEMPLDSLEAQIIVFTPKEKHKDYCFPTDPESIKHTTSSSIVLDGDWEFELKPTMDNRWGDFRLPITEKMIGAEARILNYYEDNNSSSINVLPIFSNKKESKVTYGFGQKFWKLGPLPNDVNLSEMDKLFSKMQKVDSSEQIIINGKTYKWSPYSFSWRFGIEGDPGHQGYHGLKEEITDEFICLGKPTEGLNEKIYKSEEEGSLYYLWSTAFSDKPQNVKVDMGGLVPQSIFLNGKEIKNNSDNIPLYEGANPLLLRYNSAGRGHFVMLKKDNIEKVVRTPLSMKWFDMSNKVDFDVHGNENPVGWYRFTAPPGLKNMKIRSNGKLDVWVNGNTQKVKAVNKNKPTEFDVDLNTPCLQKSEVVLRVEFSHGNYGGAAFPEPVLIECSRGIIQTGDWSLGSVLENYSGGAVYSKNINLSKEEISHVIIDLNDVVATAEVFVNGKSAGVLVSPPWKLDISDYLKVGENKFEILVYNTLANHYLTIPSRYKGNSIKSGLIGPVKLEISK